MIKKKVSTLLVVVGTIVLLGAVYAVFQRGADPRTAGLTRVDRYRHTESGQVACAALMPECGVCYGKIIDKECYVDKTKLTPTELHQMGF
jgi:hypothetical protein